MSARTNRRAVVAEYDYTDADGRVRYQVVRYSPKDFRARQPDGKGGWTWNLQGVERIPYRLPGLIEGIALGRTVYITEGEKDADALHSLGLTATTNAGGADKWRSEYNQYFAGADVVILPDNDEPGRQHAKATERAITGVAASVRILELPGLPGKGDVSDWLCDGHTLSELERLIAGQSEIAAPALEDGELPPATCALHAPPPEPLSYVVDDVFVAGEPGMIFGDGGSFKTTVALHIACAVAGGYKAFGHFNTTQRPALIVSAEDGAGVLTQRMRAMCRGHGWDEKRVLGNIHYYCLGGVALTDPKWCAKILAEITRLDAGFVMLDPYQELVPGVNQDSAQETGPHMSTLRKFCQPTGAATVLLHHAGKAAKEKRTIDRVRGSSALYSAMRLVYLITDSPNDATIKMECIKNNRAEKLKPFAIRRTIDADPDNRLHWLSARFDHITVRQAEFDQAQTFILNAIDTHGRLSSSDLKTAAKGTGINIIAISGALKSLEMLGALDFVEGKKNAKLWGRPGMPCLLENFEQPQQPEKPDQTSLPGNLAACSATTTNAPLGCLPPIGGQPTSRATSALATTNSREAV